MSDKIRSPKCDGCYFNDGLRMVKSVCVGCHRKTIEGKPSNYTKKEKLE